MGVRRLALAVLGFGALSLFSAGIASAQPPAFPPFDPAACVAKPQRLLIFDMKSGWWSGDGDQFHNVLLPRIVKDCPNVDVEYYFLQHIDLAGTPLPPGVPGVSESGIFGLLSFYPPHPGVNNDGAMVEANFPSRPWNEYTQVWLLSGSNQDDTDIPTDHEFFQKMLQRYLTPAPPGQTMPSLLVATGIGNRDHANRVLATLQMPELFQSHLSTIDTPAVPDGSVVDGRGRARAGAELTAHAIFEGVESIADTLTLGGIEYETDFLLEANNPFQVVGRNVKGEPAIGARETPERRMVIDAGMQRYYSLYKPEDAGTYRYLQNIIKYLAR
jgi:hypothetical protein